MPFVLRFLRILAPWLRISIHVRVLAVFNVTWAPANGFRNGVALVDPLSPVATPLLGGAQRFLDVDNVHATCAYLF